MSNFVVGGCYRFGYPSKEGCLVGRMCMVEEVNHAPKTGGAYIRGFDATADNGKGGYRSFTIGKIDLAESIPSKEGEPSWR